MFNLGVKADKYRWLAAGAFGVLVLATVPRSNAQPPATATATATPAPTVTYAAQGWSAADRATFYSTSQGSRIMPYAWFKALRRLDVDQPFAADQLQRYGYLRSDSASGLPVGFVVDGTAATGQVGMTCAACHTGQLEYQKDGVTHAVRLDGGRASADFQQFLTDLTAASRATLSDPARFTVFAKAVLGAGNTTAATAQLKTDFAAWVQQFGEFMDASLPDPAWGPGRLDAFGMIFNRVAARDLGVPGNFRKADAPVRYPFLWNATHQDHTQWNGGVPNGLFIQGIARNTGEVFGVFADFAPRIRIAHKGIIPAVMDYRVNSAHFGGLQTLEEKIATLQPPPWPRDVFPIDDAMAAKGKALFDAHCGTCHAEKTSQQPPHAWITPIVAVGTDPKMVLNADRTLSPGIYLGAPLPPPAVATLFVDPAKASDILAGSVVGSLLDDAFPTHIMTPSEFEQSGVWRALRKDLADVLPHEQLTELASPSHLNDMRDLVKAQLSHLFARPATTSPGTAYEARVLHGVWAVAPYLHDGSVPNLWELLKPANQRVTKFMVGSRLFDPKNVGYATDQSPFKDGAFVVDPANANGNGNGGHEYGTDLSEDERWEIIEYMKTL